MEAIIRKPNLGLKQQKSLISAISVVALVQGMANIVASYKYC
jgi:hypothetical protein